MTVRSRKPAEADRRASQRATPGLLEQRALAPPAGELGGVRLRVRTAQPLIYHKMVHSADPHIQPGDLVAVRDPNDRLLGHGVFNPRAEIRVRMLNDSSQPPDEAFWEAKLAGAVELRRDFLKLDAVTDAYRVVYSEADGLSGLVVDRYGDVLSAELYGLGMYQRSHALMSRLARICGTRHTRIEVALQSHGQEGFLADPFTTPGFPQVVTVAEFGTRFRVEFSSGHKTGFFCDQRDNRRQLAAWSAGKSVLDVCCYTGGFAVQAAVLGRAQEVIGVDLDEQAVALARDNANLNQAQVRFVHADAFSYMRDMLHNGRQWDVVVLDPPKLIRSRRELEEGTRKHLDLNRLAMQLVRPGGLLLSCSCSGLLGEVEFMKLLRTAAWQAGSPAEATAAGRSLQVLAKSGAAADHPVAGQCPETEYLHAVWMRVL